MLCKSDIQTRNGLRILLGDMQPALFVEDSYPHTRRILMRK